MWLVHVSCLDRLYALIMSIYIARELKQYESEELFYARLAFVYRSSSLMIEMTRPLAIRDR